MRFEYSNPEVLAKRIVFLAWKACGGPMGMGILQNNPGAGEAEVWKQAFGRGDYGGMGAKAGQVYADYVFGRMMKLTLSWDASSVTLSDAECRLDYQSWCSTYPTYEALAKAAIASLTPVAEAAMAGFKS